MPDFTAYTRHELDITQKEIEKAIYTVVAPLSITAWRTTEPVPYSQRKIGKKLDLNIGDRWGDLFDSAWFHFTGKIPSSAKGQPVVLLLDVNGEMLVVDQEGAPLRGLTNVASTYDYSLGLPGKRVLPITSQAQEFEIIDIWADAGANDLFGNLSQNGVIREASIAICHEHVRSLYYDFEFLLDFLKVLPPDSVRFAQILRALNDARWALASGYTDETVSQARQPLKAMLDKRGGDASLVISAAGHAHIDLAWLWPLRESKRKLARTYATVLANMEKYPHYIFGASQPQLFQWMKESYPALYERVRQRVQEGRFEPQGAMWVEADTNLSGGEALVRQLLLGKRFFQQEFGVDMHYLWLPDVFGYSAALPQILKKAGVDFFMTQKLSWNQINHFPLYSFHWTGIDGTRILAHMLPEETYNSPAAPRSVVKIEKNYAQKDVSDRCLMLFGIGDGGGGPGEEHLERLSRLKNLAGLSPVIQEPARNFFEQWKKDAGR
ncbi:MAG: alpha-mannosidase, partial [Omnitrophica WOR_2 bacterium]